MLHPPLNDLAKIQKKVKRMFTAMEMFYIKTALEKRTQIDVVL